MAKTFYNAISTVMLMVMLVFMVGTALPALDSAPDLAYAISKPAPWSCETPILQQEQTLGNSIDSSKAVSLAVSAPIFKSKVQGYSTAFHSIFNIYRLDNVNCKAILETVNVVHSVSNPSGFVKYVIATEDPELTRVINASEQFPKIHYGGGHKQPVYGSSPNWSGYEFESSPSGSNVWQATASWSVPTVSVPYSGACTSTTPCDASVWTGLDDQSGAGDGNLAQAGTDGIINNCDSTCTYSYEAWYENYYPSNPTVDCMTVNTGDSITTTVTNQYLNSGSKYSYAETINDVTKNKSCGTTTPYTFTNFDNPIYAPFIMERAAIYGGGYYTLAKFTTVSMSGNIYYSGGTHSIYVPYSNFDYVQWTMTNNLNTNIGVSSVNSAGSFTQSWWTSSGT